MFASQRLGISLNGWEIKVAPKLYKRMFSTVFNKNVEWPKGILIPTITEYTPALRYIEIMYKNSCYIGEYTFSPSKIPRYRDTVH